jgi:hypothetical protein
MTISNFVAGIKNCFSCLKDMSLRLNQALTFIRRKMFCFSQGANTFLIALACVALITYTLYLKANNHLARQRVLKGQRGQVEVAPKYLTPDGAWCWFADPRAVYHEGELDTFNCIV